MKCQWEGCRQDAYCVPEICVPGEGHAKKHPLMVIADIKVCEDHYALINLDELLFRGGPFNQGLSAYFQASAVGAGGPEPDFKRAWMCKVPIISFKYKKYAEQRQRFEAAQRAAGVKPNA